jgi:hypothetical protein
MLVQMLLFEDSKSKNKTLQRHFFINICFAQNLRNQTKYP